MIYHSSMIRFICFFLTIFFISLPSLYGEYRVYRYLVIPDKINFENKEAFIILSTLNPQSYKAYYGGGESQIELLSTWVCPGYTGNQLDYCLGP